MSKLFAKLSVVGLAVMSVAAYANQHEVIIDDSNASGSQSAQTSPTVPATQVTSGKVRFEGRVVQNTCSIATGSRDVLVKLPTVKANELTRNNAAAKGNKAFSISLEDCPLAGYITEQGDKKSNVSIYFDSSAQTVTSDGTLKEVNPAANSAKNVEIQVFNEAGAKINGVIDKFVAKNWLKAL